MAQKDDLFQLVIAGLSGSGKTTFVEHFLGKRPTFPATPTMGMDVIVEDINGHSFFIYDLGGHPSFHEKIWHVIIPKADLIVHVVDSAAPHLFRFVRKNLTMVLELAKGTPVLILANKQDLPSSKSIRELQAALDLDNLRRQHADSMLSIIPISALKGQGMPNAFSWIMKTLIGAEYSKTHLTLHGAYVYHREIGLPLGIMFPPKNDGWNAQLDQATLISGFYAAFNSFSQGFINTPSHSIILRGKHDLEQADYMFYHCNDPDTALGVLFVTAVTDEQLLETVATELLTQFKKLKEGDNLEVSEITTIIDLYPIMLDIFTTYFSDIHVKIDTRTLLPDMK